MTIVQIEPLSNGAHMNQTKDSFLSIPDGWALIPDDMDTLNFPFGQVTVEEIGGVMTVTNWTPGIIPDPPPPPEPEPEPTLDDRVSTLEATKANQTDVDELNEALNMILTGVTE